MQEQLAKVLSAGEVPQNLQPGTPNRARFAAPDAEPSAAAADDDPGRYDFDLAEFPLFRYYKNAQAMPRREPLVYSDTITGKDGAEVHREWKVHPGAFGFGGQTTQQVLYELLQLYIEQGCCGTQIQFGTPRALLRRIWPEERNPSMKDYTRVRRDLDILRGYDFHCRNAFWDRKRQAYVDMHWRLFGDVCYFKPRSHSINLQEELPFGFIEASRVLQQIARTRGFFCLGFNSELFHALRPLEQRLALYLSKKFMSQALHQRYVDDLARALPIEAARSDHLREALAKAAQGLLDAGVPTLKSFRFEKSLRTGQSLMVFHRDVKPKQDYRMPNRAALSLDPEVGLLVDDIVEQVGSRDDVLWWTKCADVLGADLVYQGLSQLKDAAHGSKPVRNRGGLLTKIFKDLARDHRRTIH